MKKWNLNSWTKFPAKHLPVYKDKEELDLVLSKIKKIFKKKYPKLSIELKIISLNSKVETFK